MTNVIREAVISTVVIDGIDRVVVSVDQTRVVSVGTQGPAGPPGPQGPPGPAGDLNLLVGGADGSVLFVEDGGAAVDSDHFSYDTATGTLRVTRVQGAVVSYTWSSAVTIDWSMGDLARVTLQGNTSFVFTGAVDGQRVLLEVMQDEVGNRSALLPLSVRYSSTIPPPLLSTGANKLDRLGFVFHAATGTYDLVAIATGF